MVCVYVYVYRYMCVCLCVDVCIGMCVQEHVDLHSAGLHHDMTPVP